MLRCPINKYTRFIVRLPRLCKISEYSGFGGTKREERVRWVRLNKLTIMRIMIYSRSVHFPDQIGVAYRCPRMFGGSVPLLVSFYARKISKETLFPFVSRDIQENTQPNRMFKITFFLLYSVQSGKCEQISNISDEYGRTFRENRR